MDTASTSSIEHVGEATWTTSLSVAAKFGRIAVCGATSGPNPPAGLHRVFWKQLTILGSSMGTRADFAGLLSLMNERELHPIVDRTFALRDVADAHRRLEGAGQLGKVILSIGD